MTSSPVTVLDGPDGVRAAVGTHLGWSPWIDVDDDRLGRFAEAVDSADAVEFLALSMSNLFLPQIVEVRGFSAGVNYGVDEVRFPARLTAGCRVRGGAELVEVTDVNGGLQTTMLISIVRDDEPEPVCSIVSLSRWLH
jgi:hypothetical protein